MQEWAGGDGRPRGGRVEEGQAKEVKGHHSSKSAFRLCSKIDAKTNVKKNTKKGRKNATILNLMLNNANQHQIN